MATPTTEESWQQAAVLFTDAMKPIWPNLTRSDTKLMFMARHSLKKDTPIFIGFDPAKGVDISSWSNPSGFIEYAKPQ